MVKTIQDDDNRCSKHYRMIISSTIQDDAVETCEYVGLPGSVSTVARQSGRDLSAGNHYDDDYDEDDGGDCDDGDACGDDHNEAKADGVCVPTIQGTYTSFSCRPDMKASLNMKRFLDLFAVSQM